PSTTDAAALRRVPVCLLPPPEPDVGRAHAAAVLRGMGRTSDKERPMVDFLRRLFDSDFLPHEQCYLRQPGLIALHASSDGLIALAYFCIPALLFYFVRKRGDVPFRWVFVMFGAFIVLCGTTHAMEVWTLWHGTYRLSGLIKAGT